MTRVWFVVAVVMLACACTTDPAQPRRRQWRVDEPAKVEPTPAKPHHASHEHAHGPHPHVRSDHHHHQHPHPHLAGANGHHHPY